MIDKILERARTKASEYIHKSNEEASKNGNTLDFERFCGKKEAYEDMLIFVQEIAKEYDWIPVWQRLPEEIMKDCLVTLENGAVFQAQYAKYNKEFRMVVPYHGIIRFHEDNPVIAWCELPTPYQKGE